MAVSPIRVKDTTRPSLLTNANQVLHSTVIVEVTSRTKKIETIIFIINTDRMIVLYFFLVIVIIEEGEKTPDQISTLVALPAKRPSIQRFSVASS